MSGWGVYDVIIEIILNIFQGFMVTWYLQKCLGTDREKKDVYITGTVYTFSNPHIFSARGISIIPVP